MVVFFFLSYGVVYHFTTEAVDINIKLIIASVKGPESTSFERHRRHTVYWNIRRLVI